MTLTRRIAVWIIQASCLAAPGVSLTACAPGRGSAAGKPEGVDLYIQAKQVAAAGNQDQAITLLEQAVAANPELRLAHAMLGDAYRVRGDYQLAATQYESTTHLDPYTYTNHYNLGLTYQFLNKLQEAAVSYLKAIQLNPKDVRSNMNLGLVYLALGSIDDAVTYLRRAAELGPDNPQVLCNFAVALDAGGKLTEAESVYRRALELDSGNVVTLQNLAQNLITQQKASEAIQIMQQVMARDNSPVSRRQYADALAAARQYDAAIEQYDQVLADNPRYLAAINGKAFALIRQYTDGLEISDKLRLAALELWKSSLRINPNQPRVAEAVAKWEHPGLFAD